MNVEYTRCLGAELQTRQGRRILDFLSGYCVYNMGHNHPRIIAAMMDELQKRGPVMLQSHIPDNAAHLAARLSQLAGGRLEKVFFTSSGSEGIETVIKFSRAFTGRSGLLYCQGGFHGLTCGALSLMVKTYLADNVDTFLAHFGLTRRDIGLWIAHPGGPKVLDAVSAALDLPNGALDTAWNCLRQVGNLSSASVLLVLEDVMQRQRPPADTYGIMLAMDPGFCSELVLLRW